MAICAEHELCGEVGVGALLDFRSMIAVKEHVTHSTKMQLSFIEV